MPTVVLLFFVFGSADSLSAASVKQFSTHQTCKDYIASHIGAPSVMEGKFKCVKVPRGWVE